LMEARDELQKLQAALGVRRGCRHGSTPPARFEELHAFRIGQREGHRGLREGEALAAHAQAALQRHRVSKGADGGEAASGPRSARGTVRPPGGSPPPHEEVAGAIGKLAPPDPQGAAALDKAQAAFATS
jgi:hypothetical protein